MFHINKPGEQKNSLKIRYLVMKQSPSSESQPYSKQWKETAKDKGWPIPKWKSTRTTDFINVESFLKQQSRALNTVKILLLWMVLTAQQHTVLLS